MSPEILLLQRHAPFTRQGEEALNRILAASQFCENFSVLFCDEGVLQLKKTSPERPEIKAYQDAYAAFEMLDIKKIFVEKSALIKNNLPSESLTLKAIPLDDIEIKKLFVSQKFIIRG